MNIAYVGLGYSHPYTYRQILEPAGHRSRFIWDHDPALSEEFAALSGAVPVATLDEIDTDEIDGAILTGRLPERIDHAIHFLERGVPIYTGKPMATSESDLSRLAEAARRTGTPLLTTSVLRYAPVLQTLRRHLDRGSVGKIVAIRAVSAHRIDRYMHEPHIWQDDPARGGGTLLSMGVHALEMLSVIFDEALVRVSCRTDRRFHTESLSEDVVFLTVEWESGLLGSIEILGGVDAEYYGVDVYGSEKIIRASVPKGDVLDHRGAALGEADPWVEFGYVGAMAAFVAMCETGESPVPLEVSEGITRALLAARIAAATNRTETIGAARD